jgi:hypothetical protein
MLCHLHSYYTGPACEIARNAETGFATKSKTSGLFCCDSIRPILPSSLASACLGDKAEPPVPPRSSKSVTGKTLPEHGPKRAEDSPKYRVLDT